MNSNLKETKQDKILVCTPDINNILHIFIPLMCFVEDIEESMGLPHGLVLRIPLCCFSNFLI